MLGVLYRVRRALSFLSETFEVSSNERRGVFSITDKEIAAKYVDETTLGGSNRPIYLIFVPNDDDTEPNDTIEYGGKSLAILNIVERRYRGVVLFKVIVAH